MKRVVSMPAYVPGEAVVGMDPYELSDAELRALRTVFRRARGTSCVAPDVIATDALASLDVAPAATSPTVSATAAMDSAPSPLASRLSFALPLPRRTAIVAGVVSAGLVVTMLSLIFRRRSAHVAMHARKKKPLAVSSAARPVGSAAKGASAKSGKTPKKAAASKR